VGLEKEVPDEALEYVPDGRRSVALRLFLYATSIDYRRS
jgi:hypothetical protein